MPKANLQGYPRAQRRTDTRSFPLPNGEVLTLTLRATDSYDAMLISARATALIESLKGNYFPLASGEAVPLEQKIAEVVCGLVAMQPETLPEDERYEEGDFLALLVSDELANVRDQVLDWVAELNAAAEQGDPAKNSPAGPTGSGSATSSTRPEPTPSLSTSSP